jgi:hypothetical protein
MKTKIMLWLAVILAVYLVMPPVVRSLATAGCIATTDMTPLNISGAPRPLRVVANNDGGLILRDANGKLYTYPRTQWFASIAFKQGFKQGDTFCP